MLFLPGPNRIKLAPAQTKSLALGSDSPIHLFYFPLSIEVCSSQICSSQIFFVQIHPMLSFFSCWNQSIFLFSNNMGAVICLNLSQLPACSKSRNRSMLQPPCCNICTIILTIHFNHHCFLRAPRRTPITSHLNDHVLWKKIVYHKYRNHSPNLFCCPVLGTSPFWKRVL